MRVSAVKLQFIAWREKKSGAKLNCLLIFTRGQHVPNLQIIQERKIWEKQRKLIYLLNIDILIWVTIILGSIFLPADFKESYCVDA